MIGAQKMIGEGVRDCKTDARESFANRNVIPASQASGSAGGPRPAAGAARAHHAAPYPIRSPAVTLAAGAVEALDPPPAEGAPLHSARPRALSPDDPAT